MVGIWWTGKHHQAREVAVAEEGEEAVADTGIRSGCCSEGGFVDLEEWRCNADHVVAVGIERTRVLRHGDLVDTKTIGVCLVGTDGSIGGEEAVGVVDRNVRDWCCLKLAGLEFLCDQRADLRTRVIQAGDLEDLASYERIDDQSNQCFIGRVIKNGGVRLCSSVGSCVLDGSIVT